MRHALLLAGLFLFAPVAKAHEPSAEETVNRLVESMHCGTGPNRERQDAEERVRRDPQTYLPLLKARVSPERIEAARNTSELGPLMSAIEALVRLGGNEGRDFLVERLSQFQRDRDVLTGQLKARAPSAGVTATPGERDALGAWVWPRNRLGWLEGTIVRRFQEAGDPRLRDVLLRRLDQEPQEGMAALYINYFAATLKADPEVRARLKALRETSDSSTTQEALKRFFAWW